MKKILTVIISAIAFGLIAGMVMVGVTIFSTETGIINNNPVVQAIEEKTMDEGIISTESVVKKPKKINKTDYEEYDDVSELIDDVMPTVVSLTNMQKFIEYGYSPFPGISPQKRETESPASGSGVIVGMTDTQVIILTNYHVIESSSGLSVTFNDTETVDAKVKGADASVDLAIVSVDKKNIPEKVLETIKISRIGDSDGIKVGEHVVAIGNALGIGQSVTTGIISAKDREIDGIDNSSKLIQIDAAINPGNSGGALLNMKGELIGINVAKTSGNAIEGMGYAIPVNVAKEVIETMSKRKDREEIPEDEQGQLGITCRTVDDQYASMFDLPKGVFVYKIDESSPVKNSELKPRDVIISFDEQPVKTISDLQELLRYTRAGEEVNIKVMRSNDGEYVEKEFKVKLGKKKVEENKENVQDQGSIIEQPKEQEQYNYVDPFSEFDDIFRHFGIFPW